MCAHHFYKIIKTIYVFKYWVYTNLNIAAYQRNYFHEINKKIKLLIIIKIANKDEFIYLTIF